MVKEGEREEDRRTKREEALVAEQMAAIRRQVHLETEKKRRCVLLCLCLWVAFAKCFCFTCVFFSFSPFRQHLVGVARVSPFTSAPPPVLDGCECEVVMECAGECVRKEERERRRRETRAELVRQLEERNLSERRERTKVEKSLQQIQVPSYEVHYCKLSN